MSDCTKCNTYTSMYFYLADSEDCRWCQGRPLDSPYWLWWLCYCVVVNNSVQSQFVKVFVLPSFFPAPLSAPEWSVWSRVTKQIMAKSPTKGQAFYTTYSCVGSKTKRERERVNSVTELISIKSELREAQKLSFKFHGMNVAYSVTIRSVIIDLDVTYTCSLACPHLNVWSKLWSI